MALYPPIVASSMPAFAVEELENNIYTGNVKIYFSLSSYNSNKKDLIRTVHLTCRRQSSNVNVLNAKGLIKIYSFGDIVDNRTTTDIAQNRYFVTLSSDDLVEGGFKPGVAYKIQLRLSTSSSLNELNVNFFTSNIYQHSLWSTVCIIKPILKPLFYINEFHTEDDDNLNSNLEDSNTHFSNLADFVGTYIQKDDNSQEQLRLKTWRLRLLNNSYTQEDYDNIDDFTLADSNWMFVSANNYTLDDENLSLECSLAYELLNNQKYKLLFEILTKNDYYDSILNNFICSYSANLPLLGTLKTYVNNEEGYIKLDFVSLEVYNNNAVIRRTDSRSNFQKWEDLKNFVVNDSWNFTYYDFTVLSGILYRYLVQKRDTRGRRGMPVYDLPTKALQANLVELEQPLLLESTGNGDLIGTKQLKLKYDFQISSYKTNISESKTDTIGSKYPFIRRNGSMYYRSFPITGTITEYMDEASLFTNTAELFDNKYLMYQSHRGDYNENNPIFFTHKYDYTYERKFREKVELFLYNSKPKLYKSMQEGNILIKLMEISLTPKNELGRLVYTFSATAYEIDEPTIEAFNNYGFITVGEYKPLTSRPIDFMGQISSFSETDNPFPIDDKTNGVPFEKGKDIIGADSTFAASNSIAKRFKYKESFNGLITDSFTIDWLRLTIEDEPYLIILDSSFVINGSKPGFKPFDDERDRERLSGVDFNDLYTFEDANIYLGTLFYIGTPGNLKSLIIAPPNNIYEIKDDNFKINNNYQIIPAKNTLMSVDIRAKIYKVADTSSVPKNIRTKTTNGQLVGTYSSSSGNLISKINYKYSFTYTDPTTNDKVIRKSQGVKTLLIDTLPNTVVKIKTNTNQFADEGLLRFVINETGELKYDLSNIKTQNAYISFLQFYGRNVQLRYYGKNYGTTVPSNPQHGDYYKPDLNESKINFYYKDRWLEGLSLQDNGETVDIPCLVDALVFYTVNVESDYY